MEEIKEESPIKVQEIEIEKANKKTDKSEESESGQSSGSEDKKKELFSENSQATISKKDEIAISPREVETVRVQEEKE